MTMYRRRPRPWLIPALSFGWGNTAWSASEGFLAVAIEQAQQVSGPILECGSGLSSLLVASALMTSRRRRTTYWALEHSPTWGEFMFRQAHRYDLTNICFCVEPLVDYGEFTWYAPPPRSRKLIGLVICDGPPGDTPGGRYGLLPVMRDRLAPGCTIILDDLVRIGEQEIMLRWKREFDVQGVVTGDRPFAILKVPAHINWPSGLHSRD